VSGETDFIFDRQRIVVLKNGHPLMARITAMGCAASSIIGAFLAVEKDSFQATQAAMAVMSIAGELAALESKSPGTFQVKFLDALDQIQLDDLTQRLNLAAAS